MANFPEIVTFGLTSKCNNKCKYCYAQDWGSDLDFITLKKVFSGFANNGVKALILTGGEPLLRKDFRRIILELKKLKLKIFLNTSGDLFFNYANLILNNVDVLGLPVDFSNKSYRNKDNFKNIVKILKYLKTKKKKPLVRVGTVVTLENYNDIANIGKLLMKYDIDTWKIYEFIPKSHGLLNKKELMISSKLYGNLTKKILKLYPKLKIVVAKRRSRSKAHFIVASSGTVFVPLHKSRNSKNIVLGNILDKDITKKWQKYISNFNYRNNMKNTYNYDFD